MRLSDGVEQAMHCCVLMAGLAPDGVLSASALSQVYDVSTSYLLKHLQAMSGAGLLAATSGPKGGYRLAKTPENITLLDIVLAVEGSAPAFRCAEIRQRGPDPLPQRYFSQPCQINAAMLRAEKAYRSELAKVSIADLLQDLHASDDGGIAARSCIFIEQHQRRSGARTP